jgi:hypothetical protein
LAAGFNMSGSPVTASASGSTIALTAIATGTASNYPLSSLSIFKILQISYESPWKPGISGSPEPAAAPFSRARSMSNQ